MDHSIKIKKEFKEKGNSRYICLNELGEACFQHDIACEDFKDLNKRTAADKVLHDKVFNIANNPQYDEFQHGLVSMVYKLFDKKTSGGATKNEIMSNKQLAEELHKPIISKFETNKSTRIFYRQYLRHWETLIKDLDFH